ncbi:hypothetical protein GHJ84_19050 [Sinorhizobium meliloti]|nr:hypothetical protein [Sinorhizobium meliloti]
MGSFEPLIAPIADDHLRAKGAVRHEPCAGLVARMFTFWAKKIAYCIVRNDRDCRCASNSASDWNCAGPGKRSISPGGDIVGECVPPRTFRQRRTDCRRLSHILPSIAGLP